MARNHRREFRIYISKKVLFKTPRCNRHTTKIKDEGTRILPLLGGVEVLYQNFNHLKRPRQAKIGRAEECFLRIFREGRFFFWRAGFTFALRFSDITINLFE